MTLTPENKLQLQSFFASFLISHIDFKNKQMNFHSHISVSSNKLDAGNKTPNPAIRCLTRLHRRQRAPASTPQLWR